MNFKHLHYFWVTARAGGIMRAGEQLHTTPQTLSGQIKLLEERLGRKLFRKSGRQLALTEEGRLWPALSLRPARGTYATATRFSRTVRGARL